MIQWQWSVMTLTSDERHHCGGKCEFFSWWLEQGGFLKHTDEVTKMVLGVENHRYGLCTFWKCPHHIAWRSEITWVRWFSKSTCMFCVIMRHVNFGNHTWSIQLIALPLCTPERRGSGFAILPTSLLHGPVTQARVRVSVSHAARKH